MPDTFPVSSHAGSLRGLRLDGARVSRTWAKSNYGRKKIRRETFRFSFGFDPAVQPGSDGWSFVLRFAFFPSLCSTHEAWIEWTSPSGGRGRRALPETQYSRRAESAAKAAGAACGRGRGTEGRWRAGASLHLSGLLEDALFRVRPTRALLHFMVWDDEIQTGNGPPPARRRRDAISVVADGLPLAAWDEASALGAIAVARGLLASDPLHLGPMPGTVGFELLEGELSLLPPLPPERKDRRGHGDGWLLVDGCSLFDSKIGFWLAERMADLGLILRPEDPHLGWRALAEPARPLSDGDRTESRRFVPLGSPGGKDFSREIAKGPNHVGGKNLSFHERLEILAGAEESCVALTGRRLDGSSAA